MRPFPMLLAALAVAALALPSGPARAFCGFYVAKADTRLYNQASKVVIARHEGGETVISMVNDYQGDPKEFAIVIPVPTVLAREQIHVTDNAVIDHLDAYTAPRLVEYFDPDPCRAPWRSDLRRGLASKSISEDSVSSPAALGVAVEARYTVGEYDILILSAEESGGLVTWLGHNGYRLPEGVGPVLADYIAAGMRFIVARVNLAEQARLGYRYLRPLQLAFDSPRFMLPIRLGMANAQGPQELFVIMLTRKGRVETRNYPTVPMPSNLDVPIFVKDEFGDFYRAMFASQTEKAGGRAVFLEYAWDMAWCDPCAADPLSVAELRELGVFWLETPAGIAAIRAPARDVFVTRLHLRYDGEHFPEDLMFKETDERTNFQGRYVLRHPYTGPARCRLAQAYSAALPERYEREAQTLARLTAWPIDGIRARMERAGQSFAPPPPGGGPGIEWWRELWPQG